LRPHFLDLQTSFIWDQRCEFVWPWLCFKAWVHLQCTISHHRFQTESPCETSKWESSCKSSSFCL